MNKMAKKGEWMIFAVLTILSVICLMQGAMASPISISACQGVSPITNGSYIVTNLINNSGGFVDCFIFDDSNIEFDCDGNVIDDNSGSSYNAFSTMMINATNITIKNCNIQHFSTAIIISYIDNNSFIFNNTISSEDNGIKLNSVSNSQIYDNKFANTTTFAGNQLYISNGSNFDIINNNEFDGLGIQYNILIQDGTGAYAPSMYNLIKDNLLNIGGGFVGASIYVGAYDNQNIFLNNTINCITGGATSGCLELVGSSLNVISQNQIYSQNTRAIGLVNSPINNLITNNFLIYNQSVYMELDVGSNCKNNTILNSTIVFITYSCAFGNCGNSEANIGWYARIIVKDKFGTNVQNANVKWFNITGNPTHSLLTDVSGTANANLTEYYFVNTSYFYQTYYTLNVSSDGVENVSQLNFSDSFTYVVYLDYNSSNVTNVTNITTNALPVINSIEFSAIWSVKCVKPNTTVVAKIYATDKENETINYAHRCSDLDATSTFNNNNTKTCFYSNEGEYNLGLFINDTNMTIGSHIAYYQYVRVTTEECISPCENPNECTTIPVNPADIDDINKGLFPTVYFGLISFITAPLPSVFIIFIAIIVVLLISLIGVIISKIAKFGEG